MDKLRALEYFVAAAEERSLSGAARRLNVSVPAVSKLIRPPSARSKRLFDRTAQSLARVRRRLFCDFATCSAACDGDSVGRPLHLAAPDIGRAAIASAAGSSPGACAPSTCGSAFVTSSTAQSPEASACTCFGAGRIHRPIWCSEPSLSHASSSALPTGQDTATGPQDWSSTTCCSPLEPARFDLCSSSAMVRRAGGSQRVADQQPSGCGARPCAVG
jgi:hypothetical protein